MARRRREKWEKKIISALNMRNISDPDINFICHSLSPKDSVHAEWQRTVIQTLLNSGRKYWTTCLSARSFTCTGHLLACSALLILIARSAALTRSQWNIFAKFSKCPDSLCSVGDSAGGTKYTLRKVCRCHR